MLNDLKKNYSKDGNLDDFIKIQVTPFCLYLL